MRLQLIVTGDVERQALATSLGRAWPEELVWLEPIQVNSATSFPANPDAEELPTTFKKLARALVATALFPPNPRAPADLVIAVDDLELANRAAPEAVTACLARAVREDLASRPPHTRAHASELVRSKCSFHLMAPMIESYFFGAPAAIAAHATTTGLDALSIAERFAVADATYDHWYTTTYPGSRPAWFDHRGHPKHYLEHLLSLREVIYHETDHGKTLLTSLPWTALPTAAPELAFARSLFEDIAEALGIANPLGPGPTHDATYPPARIRRETLTLRNL